MSTLTRVSDEQAALDRAVIRSGRTTGRARAVVVSTVLAAACFLMFCVSVSLGEFPVPLTEVPRALIGLGAPDYDFIIRELRLPRALVAVLVGVAFGLSGAIFQSLARNPLASPDIIGITAGASTAAVFIIVVFGAGGATLSLGALGGALVTAIAVYVLAWKRGVSSYRLVLIGIGVAAILSSITSYLLTRAEIYEAQRATVWLTGSLNGRGWEHVEPITYSLVVLVPAALLLTRSLRSLQLGDDTAAGLGVRVETARALLILVGVALAAVATAAAGPVAFVAFVSAPVARRLLQAPLTMVPAALVGALLMLTSDVIGRQLLSPTELPVGIITGIIGAPYLLWLLARANRIGTGG